jgi:hypothetical protein
MNQEEIEAKKKRLQFLQEAAREKNREASKAAQRANQYEKEIYELENGQKETPKPPVS